MVLFSPPHQPICPPSLEWYTSGGLLAWEGVVALSRKREEKGAAADPGLVRGEHVPKVPTPLHPWTCCLRTGRGKASPVGRTLLGGHAQKCLPVWTPSRVKEEETLRVEQVLPPQYNYYVGLFVSLQFQCPILKDAAPGHVHLYKNI